MEGLREEKCFKRYQEYYWWRKKRELVWTGLRASIKAPYVRMADHQMTDHRWPCLGWPAVMDGGNSEIHYQTKLLGFIPSCMLILVQALWRCLGQSCHVIWVEFKLIGSKEAGRVLMIVSITTSLLHPASSWLAKASREVLWLGFSDDKFFLKMGWGQCLLKKHWPALFSRSQSCSELFWTIFIQYSNLLFLGNIVEKMVALHQSGFCLAMGLRQLW